MVECSFYEQGHSGKENEKEKSNTKERSAKFIKVDGRYSTFYC